MELLKMLNEAKLHSRTHFEGLDISVEVPAGGYRRGINKKTKEEWSYKIPASYGYIKGTHSPDGEHLDCYLRKNPKKGAQVYVMHQLTVDGSRFDEDKVMLGYSSKSEAIKAFKSMLFKPGTMYGGCTEFDMEHFQVIAFSASNSHAMLTKNSTYDEFKRKGLLPRNIKSPLMVARKVCEGLAEGLTEISQTLSRGDLEECLDWSGYHEGSPVEAVLTRAYGHYTGTPYMHDFGTLSEEEFKAKVLNYIMEQDALLTDTEDHYGLEEAVEELEPIGEDLSHTESGDRHSSDLEIEEVMEEAPMTNETFAVVVHTQMMENIGTAENPSWATAGTKVLLVQEDLTTWGEARSVAAKVAAGQIPVEISENAHVLGIDVIPSADYHYLYEETQEEEQVKETTTDDVFFQQQVMEMKAKAGIRDGSYENQGTPSVHETRERLAQLTADFYEAMEAEELKEASSKLTDGQLAQALRTVKEALKVNPHANVNQVIRAVCKKLFGNPNLDDEVIKYAEFEYGSIDEFDDQIRGKKVPEKISRVITKYEN